MKRSSGRAFSISLVKTSRLFLRNAEMGITDRKLNFVVFRLLMEANLLFFLIGLFY